MQLEERIALCQSLEKQETALREELAKSHNVIEELKSDQEAKSEQISALIENLKLAEQSTSLPLFFSFSFFFFFFFFLFLFFPFFSLSIVWITI